MHLAKKYEHSLELNATLFMAMQIKVKQILRLFI